VVAQGQHRQPPGARRPSNSVALDPISFTPGDILELRVEVFDRNDTQLPCAQDQQSCSLSANTCIQRQTWFVEVR
jgi:hypothetical protein